MAQQSGLHLEPAVFNQTQFKMGMWSKSKALATVSATVLKFLNFLLSLCVASVDYGILVNPCDSHRSQLQAHSLKARHSLLHFSEVQS